MYPSKRGPGKVGGVVRAGGRGLQFLLGRAGNGAMQGFKARLSTGIIIRGLDGQAIWTCESPSLRVRGGAVLPESPTLSPGAAGTGDHSDLQRSDLRIRMPWVAFFDIAFRGRHAVLPRSTALLAASEFCQTRPVPCPCVSPSKAPPVQHMEFPASLSQTGHQSLGDTSPSHRPACRS